MPSVSILASFLSPQAGESMNTTICCIVTYIHVAPLAPSGTGSRLGNLSSHRFMTNFLWLLMHTLGVQPSERAARSRGSSR